MRFTARVSPEGRLELPPAVLDALRLKDGGEVTVQAFEGALLDLIPVRGEPGSSYAALAEASRRLGRTLSIEEMDAGYVDPAHRD